MIVDNHSVSADAAGHQKTAASPKEWSVHIMVYRARALVGAVSSSLLLIGCNDQPSPTPAYTIGGTVSGLVGSGLALQNSLGGVVSVGAKATTFTFSALPEGTSYNVTVRQQPGAPGQTCTVSNGAGTVGTASVTTIAVTCEKTTDRFAYVTNPVSQSITIYSIAAASGALAAIGPFAMTGSMTSGMVFEPSKRFAYVANGATATLSVLAVNENSGALTVAATVPTVAGVFELAMDPVGRFLYASSPQDQVRAYSINQTDGKLSEVPGTPFALGGAGRELKVDPTGKFLYVANETLGALNAFAIDQATGALAALPGSPFTALPSALGVEIDPAGEHVYSVSRIAGAIAGFSLGASTGALTPLAGSPYTATPTSCSMAIHPLASFAFVPNSPGTNGTVSTFSIAADGGLTQIQGSPVTAAASPCSVAVDPSGSFVYVANSGSANVSGYSINATTGVLTALTGSPFAALNGADTIVIR
jgi:6-phosphogluconolactonase (cycloisomerase 2 family)